MTKKWTKDNKRVEHSCCFDTAIFCGKDKIAECINVAAPIITAAPELKSAGEKLDGLIVKAQTLLTDYLTETRTKEDAISLLLGLLDGPEQREAQNAWKEAINKAEDAPPSNESLKESILSKARKS